MKHERDFEARISMIRKNLSNTDQKMLDHRQKRFDEMPMKGIDRTIMMCLKTFQKSKSSMGEDGSGGGSAPSGQGKAKEFRIAQA